MCVGLRIQMVMVMRSRKAMGIVVVLGGVLVAAVLRMAGMVGAAHAQSSTLRRLRRGGERD